MSERLGDPNPRVWVVCVDNRIRQRASQQPRIRCQEENVREELLATATGEAQQHLVTTPALRTLWRLS